MNTELTRESLMQLNDFPNYYASNLGNVYRKKKNGSYRKLKPYHGGSNRGSGDKGKYEVVCIYQGGAKYRKYVHQLVLEAFQGPRPFAHYQACHNDGNRLNNVNWNLRWDSPQGNMADAKKHKEERERQEEAKATLKGDNMDRELDKEVNNVR